MRIVFFKTPKPKKFNFPARYFDPKKEEWERRKAELGYDTSLSKEDQLRYRMESRWVHPTDTSGDKTVRLIKYFLYIVFIVGSIYVILFTPLVNNLLALFGVVVPK